VKNRERMRQRRAANPEKFAEYDRRWRAKRKDTPEFKARKRAIKVKSEYGIDSTTYSRLIALQGNACAICRLPFTETLPSVDHCHLVGDARGLLCGDCNVGIGLLREQHFDAAVRYLLDPPAFRPTPDAAQDDVASEAPLGKVKRLCEYDLSEGQYLGLWVRQRGACAICREQFVVTPHVDHHHLIGDVRGLLCRPCNKGIGRFEDNPERVAAAKAYVLDPPAFRTLG
jgi:hypothetical protein